MRIIPRININYGHEEIIALIKTFFIKKKYRELFEDAFEKKFNPGKCFAVSSARGALYLILKSLNLPRNTEIIVPEYTFFAIPKVVNTFGFINVYAKVDTKTLCIDPEDILSKITEKTKVVIIEHSFGQSVKIEEIKKICLAKNIVLIEDCAQSCGCKYNGKYAGTFGDFSYFSFAYGKNLTTCNGGMIAVNNNKYILEIERFYATLQNPPFLLTLKNILIGLAQWILTKKKFFMCILFPYLYVKSLVSPKKYIDSFLEEQNIYPYANIEKSIFKLSSQQAAIGLPQLNKIDFLNKKRISNSELLKKTIHEKEQFTTNEKSEHTYNCFAVKSDNLKKTLLFLIKRGIDARADWMSWFPEKNNNFQILYLPNHPDLNQNDMEYISKIFMLI